MACGGQECGRVNDDEPYAEFAVAVARANLTFRRKVHESCMEAAEGGDWRAGLELSARRFPEEYSERRSAAPRDRDTAEVWQIRTGLPALPGLVSRPVSDARHHRRIVWRRVGFGLWPRTSEPHERRAAPGDVPGVRTCDGPPRWISHLRSCWSSHTATIEHRVSISRLHRSTLARRRPRRRRFRDR